MMEDFYVSALKVAFITFASIALVRAQSYGNTELSGRLGKSLEKSRLVLNQ